MKATKYYEWNFTPDYICVYFRNHQSQANVTVSILDVIFDIQYYIQC